MGTHCMAKPIQYCKVKFKKKLKNKNKIKLEKKKIVRREINSLRYADDTILMAESEEEQKNLLMRVKEECERTDLKTK